MSTHTVNHSVLKILFGHEHNEQLKTYLQPVLSASSSDVDVVSQLFASHLTSTQTL